MVACLPFASGHPLTNVPQTTIWTNRSVTMGFFQENLISSTKVSFIFSIEEVNRSVVKFEMDYSAVFEVRNDKDRGVLVLTIRWEEADFNVHFFKYQHQPIAQHPEQIQSIVRLAKPKTRTKSVRVNIVSFAAIYWNVSAKFFEFKGLKLDSNENQVARAQEIRINKEVGIIKRKITSEVSKKNKDEAVREKLVSDERKFQLERAKRIKEAMGNKEEMETSGTDKN